MRPPYAAFLGFALLGAAACSESNDPDIAARATAVIRDAAGAQVGSATITEDENANVVVSISVTGMTAGQHGVHLHTTGTCDPSGATPFSSAGAHYNPFTKEHGLENPNGAHAGDMPNIPVGSNGAGTLTYTNPRVRLTSGANSLLDADGSAIVVHAGTDDQVTDPQGNSGARIACGVLQAQ